MSPVIFNNDHGTLETPKLRQRKKVRTGNYTKSIVLTLEYYY